jgi:hypothetical protein
MTIKFAAAPEKNIVGTRGQMRCAHWIILSKRMQKGRITQFIRTTGAPVTYIHYSRGRKQNEVI